MQEPLTRVDARANRARLIEAAVSVLAEDGPNAEMRRIAERAGVSTGTLYRNFPTKDDLVFAMFTEAKEHLRETLSRAAAVDDPLAALRRLLEGGFAAAQRFGVLAALSGARHERRQQYRHEDMNEELVQSVAALVRRAIEARVLRSDLDVEFTTLRLISLFEPRLVRRQGHRLSVDEQVELSLAFFLRGAGVPPTAAPTSI